MSYARWLRRGRRRMARFGPHYVRWVITDDTVVHA
jgi:hypothetical protein